MTLQTRISQHDVDRWGCWTLADKDIPLSVLQCLDDLVDDYDKKTGLGWDRESVLTHLLAEQADSVNPQRASGGRQPL